LGRRQETIVGLYPRYGVVTQALQHIELAHHLMVGETNCCANFSSCGRFKRFVWFTRALWQDHWEAICLPCKGEIDALVLRSQDHTASRNPFLDSWHKTIPGVIKNHVWMVHRRRLLHTRRPNASPNCVKTQFFKIEPQQNQ
jgi:hypothetical protein